jgi:hypothetical protein
MLIPKINSSACQTTVNSNFFLTSSPVKYIKLSGDTNSLVYARFDTANYDHRVFLIDDIKVGATAKTLFTITSL